jgi:hypothetical protein
MTDQTPPRAAGPTPTQRDPFQTVDDDARARARGLIEGAAYGALGTLEPGSGHPLATRVAVATDASGTPLLLMSTLSAHTQSLLADARCSLLLGEPGAGDPLAHPRITLIGRATPLTRDSAEHAQARARWLARHPKAQLYIDFGDFSLWQLQAERALLNAGFGRAWQLQAQDLRAG